MIDENDGAGVPLHQISVQFEIAVAWEVIPLGGARRGWRGRLAAALRRLSCRLDRSVCVAVAAATSEPALTARDAARCLEAGVRHGGTLWIDLAREAAIDRLMPQALPELYPDEPAQ